MTDLRREKLQHGLALYRDGFEDLKHRLILTPWSVVHAVDHTLHLIHLTMQTSWYLYVTTPKVDKATYNIPVLC